MPGRHLTGGPGILPPHPPAGAHPPSREGVVQVRPGPGHHGPTPVLVPAPSEVLTLQDAALLLQVDAGALRRLAEAGDLPGRLIGGQWRFSRAAILQWLALGESGRVSAPARRAV